MTVKPFFKFVLVLKIKNSIFIATIDNTNWYHHTLQILILTYDFLGWKMLDELSVVKIQVIPGKDVVNELLFQWRCVALINASCKQWLCVFRVNECNCMNKETKTLVYVSKRSRPMSSYKITDPPTHEKCKQHLLQHNLPSSGQLKPQRSF